MLLSGKKAAEEALRIIRAHGEPVGAQPAERAAAS